MTIPTTTLDDCISALKYCGSYERLPTALEIFEFMEVADTMHVLGEIWEVCDNIGIYLDDLQVQFARYFDYAGSRGNAQIPEMMTPAERDHFAKLPDSFLVYRGCYATNKWGLSWTTDKALAKKFPTLARYRQMHAPMLVTARVRKADVLAVKLGRGESEIICSCRPKHINTTYLSGGAA